MKIDYVGWNYYGWGNSTACGGPLQVCNPSVHPAGKTNLVTTDPRITGSAGDRRTTRHSGTTWRLAPSHSATLTMTYFWVLMRAPLVINAPHVSYVDNKFVTHIEKHD